MNLGNKELEFLFEKAVKLLSEHMPIAESERKPVVMHAIRVGMYLYEQEYSNDVVIGGLLHDIFEQTIISHETISEMFGENVYQIVLANTQSNEIEDTAARWQDMVLRCVKVGKEALIVKSVDVIDSYRYYKAISNPNELQRSIDIGQFILSKIPSGIEDPIFGELKNLVRI